MSDLRAVSLRDVMSDIASGPKPNRVLWQTPDSIAFVARGRVGRSEFHDDPSDEVMYMVKGDMNLHYRTPDGEEKVVVVREGEIVHCPANVPHTPKFAPDAFVLVLERSRRVNEDDRFTWYCEHCGAQLYEVVKHVADYGADPVTRAYAEFWDKGRTCGKCGHVTPRPANT
jgi:3-hydroxyanthranilate 3,4-dioxygenase